MGYDILSMKSEHLVNSYFMILTLLLSIDIAVFVTELLKQEMRKPPPAATLTKRF